MSIRQPRKFAIKIVTQDQAASAEHWRIPNDDTETKEPPAKRRRIISVHPTLWDAHGNDMVTVQMGDVRFRLHSSWLAKHSSFFRSLLDGKDVGAQARIERKSEGGDIYHVSAASAADFGILLSAMDNAINLHNNPPSFPAAASILHAAASLGFVDFRTWAIGYLQRMWSKDLQDLTVTRLPYAAETIALAHRYHIPNVSQRAYYEILRTPGLIQSPEQKIRNTEDNEGGLEEIDWNGSLRDSDANIDATGENFGSYNYPLSASQLHQLVLVREQLTECWRVAAAMPPRSPKCSKTTCLWKVYEHWRNAVHRSGLYTRYIYDPVCGLDALANVDWDGGGLDCDDCLKAMKANWATQRLLLWDAIEVWLMI